MRILQSKTLFNKALAKELSIAGLELGLTKDSVSVELMHALHRLGVDTPLEPISFGGGVWLADLTNEVYYTFEIV